MKTGSFTYQAWNSPRLVTLNVRECANPAATRAFLEELLGRPVRWTEHRA